MVLSRVLIAPGGHPTGSATLVGGSDGTSPHSPDSRTISRTTFHILAGIATVVTFAVTGCGSSVDLANSGATQVRFEVWGVAPNGVDITYGGEGTDLDGTLPLDVTMTIDPDVGYYNVSAQLNGGGDIRCAVTIGDEVRDGHARGGYRICSAQLSAIGGDWR